MNEKGKNRDNNSNKNVQSPFMKWAIRLGFGAFLLGGAYLAVKEYKKLTEVPPECEDDETSSTNDRTRIEEEIKTVDYNSSREILDELKSQLEDESMFGPGDLIVIDYDEEGELDKIHRNFAAITYHESDGERDGRFNMIVKVRDGNLEMDFDGENEILEKRFKDMIDEAKGGNPNFRKIRCSIKSLAFIGEVDGRSASSLSYSELRKLDSLEGIRYISIDLYGCESDDGVDFVRRLLSLMHPDGGEYGSELDLMPVILVMENGRMELPSNNVVRNFFKTMNVKK